MQLVIEAYTYKVSLFFATEVEEKMNTHISMAVEGIQAHTLPVRGCIKLKLVQSCYKLFFSCKVWEHSFVTGLSV